jgi:hypothetical protein
MADDLGEAGKELLAAAKVRGRYGEKPGPLKTAVSIGKFDEVHLLSNYAEIVHKPFATWLGGTPDIHAVEVTASSSDLRSTTFFAYSLTVAMYSGIDFSPLFRLLAHPENARTSIISTRVAVGLAAQRRPSL